MQPVRFLNFSGFSAIFYCKEPIFRPNIYAWNVTAGSCAQRETGNEFGLEILAWTGNEFEILSEKMAGV